MTFPGGGFPVAEGKGEGDKKTEGDNQGCDKTCRAITKEVDWRVGRGMRRGGMGARLPPSPGSKKAGPWFLIRGGAEKVPEGEGEGVQKRERDNHGGRLDGWGDGSGAPPPPGMGRRKVPDSLFRGRGCSHRGPHRPRSGTGWS